MTDSITKVENNILELELELTREKLYLEALNKSKIWTPKLGDIVNFVDSRGDTITRIYKETYTDNSFVEIGNCFISADEAKKDALQVLVNRKLKAYAKAHNKSVEGAPCYLYHICLLGGLISITVLNTTVHYASSDVLFFSYEIAEKAAKSIGADTLKKAWSV